MKTLFTFLFVTLIGLTSLFAQAPDAGDAAYVAGWTAPIPGWWPQLPAGVPVRKQVVAKQVYSFDAQVADFGC